MTNIHIISAVCGNLPVVRECIESWLPLPEGFDLTIYDSRASELDGTAEYLRTLQKETGFKLIQDGYTRYHGAAIGEILKGVHDGWVLHLDSDAKLLSRFFYSWLRTEIGRPVGYQLCGRVNDGFPQFRVINNEWRLMFPRLAAWLMLVERRFIADNQLSFDELGVRGKRVGGSVPGEVPEETRTGSRDLSVYGDTGWQLFWMALRLNAFGRMPDDAWKCWQHKHAASRTWVKQHRRELEAKRLK